MVYAQTLTVRDWLLGLLEDPAETLHGQRAPPPPGCFPLAPRTLTPGISPFKELAMTEQLSLVKNADI